MQRSIRAVSESRALTSAVCARARRGVWTAVCAFVALAVVTGARAAWAQPFEWVGYASDIEEDNAFGNQWANGANAAGPPSCSACTCAQFASNASANGNTQQNYLSGRVFRDTANRSFSDFELQALPLDYRVTAVYADVLCGYNQNAGHIVRMAIRLTGNPNDLTSQLCAEFNGNGNCNWRYVNGANPGLDITSLQNWNGNPSLLDEIRVRVRKAAVGSVNIGDTCRIMAYRLVVRGYGCPDVTITQPPQNRTVACGSGVTFSAGATGYNLSYQWSHDGAPIPGATGPVYSIASVSAQHLGFYDVEVTDACGNSDVAFASLDAIEPVVTAHPGSVSLCPGATHTLSVGATGSQLQYQWFRNGGVISGATGSTLRLTNFGSGVYQEGDYDVRITDPCGNEVWSNAAEVLLYEPPLVKSDPEDVTACPNASASFAVDASGHALQFQWHFAPEATPTAFAPIPGATGPTLHIASATPARLGWYKTRVTDGCGRVDWSGVAALTSLCDDPPEFFAWSGACSGRWREGCNWLVGCSPCGFFSDVRFGLAQPMLAVVDLSVKDIGSIVATGPLTLQFQTGATLMAESLSAAGAAGRVTVTGAGGITVGELAGPFILDGQHAHATVDYGTTGPVTVRNGAALHTGADVLGTLTVQSGATVDDPSGFGATLHGPVSVTGVGSTLTAHELATKGTTMSVSSGGRGALWSVAPGAAVHASGVGSRAIVEFLSPEASAIASQGGAVEIGWVEAGSRVSLEPGSYAVLDLLDGEITGSGSVEPLYPEFPFVDNWGDLSPGVADQESVGALAILGDFYQASSRFGPPSGGARTPQPALTLDLQGPTPGERDSFSVSGDAVLGGALVLRRAPSYLPPGGTQVDLVQIAGATLSGFDVIYDIRGFPDDRFFRVFHPNADGAGQPIYAVVQHAHPGMPIGPPTSQLAYPIPSASALGDVDGDMLADLVLTFPGSPGSAVVLFSQGAPGGTFAGFGGAVTFSDVGAAPAAVVIADVDSDGKKDIVVSSKGSASVVILRNEGNRTFSSPQFFPFTQPSAPAGLCIADLNRDGRPEIIVADRLAGSVRILQNTTVTDVPSFVYRPPIHFLNAEPTTVGSGDLEGDKEPDDLVVGDAARIEPGVVPSIRVLSNITPAAGADVELEQIQSVPVGGTPVQIFVRDLHASASGPQADLADVVTVNDEGTVSVFANRLLINGPGEPFSPPAVLDVGDAATSSAILDEDNDGDLDLIVVASPDGGPLILRELVSQLNGGEQLSFTLRDLPNQPPSPVFVEAGDITGDMSPDLVAIIATPEDASLHRPVAAPLLAAVAQAVGADGAPHTISPLPNPNSFVAGDLNNDHIVNFLDLNIVLSEYGQSGYLRGDANHDGLCDFIDLNIVLSHYGGIAR